MDKRRGDLSQNTGQAPVEMWRPCEFDTKLGYDYLQKGFWKSLLHTLVIWPVLGILRLLDALLFDFHIHGMERYKALRHTGVVGVCNHVHYLDCTMVALTLWRKRMYFMTLEENFRIPVVRRLIRALGAVPQSGHSHRTRELFAQLELALRQGDAVQIYPERDLRPYYNQSTRKMQRGAFRLAVQAQAPILPMAITYRAPKGIYRIKKKPCMDLTILPPIYPPAENTPHADRELLRRTQQAMDDFLQAHPYSFSNEKRR